MNEHEYIVATDLAKLRAAVHTLSDVVQYKEKEGVLAEDQEDANMLIFQIKKKLQELIELYEYQLEDMMIGED